MLRLPRFGVARPRTLSDAVALLAQHGPNAHLIAGGTDLLPNLKHRLFEPEILVALDGIVELRQIRLQRDGALAIGAMTPLDTLAKTDAVPPALRQAAGLVASPQLRRVGTLGGNLLSDTRCRYYNQSRFWRNALGFCLKKDGTVCHVVEGGTKCVAAVANDSVPALMTLGARLVFASARGERTIAIDDFFKADGASNKHIEPGEILVTVDIPRLPSGHRGAYGKLRDRESIDFPLFGVAVRLDLDRDERVTDADVVCGALAARPLRINGSSDALRGTRPGKPDFDAAVQRVAERAHKSCRPLENLPGDAEWRREMVPVIVRRTLLGLAQDAR